jgi:peroxiredoxin
MRLYFWLLVLLVSACKSSLPPDATIISGTINGAGGQFVYLEKLTVTDLVRVDSIKADNDGNFEFSYSPIEAGFFLLKIGNGDFVTVLLDKGDRLELKADTSTFPNEYEISGNKDSGILQYYFTRTAKNQKSLDSLSKIFRVSTHLSNFYEIKPGLDSAFVELFARQQELVRQTIKENPNSLASLLLFNQTFASKTLLTPETDFELMQQIDSSLSSRYPGNMHVVAHHERLVKILEELEQQEEAEARLAPGQPAPNLNLADPSGKYISLKSLEGSYVLINFWASYSPPCRAANIQLKEIYQKYKSKGLEVYAVSFDHNRKIWNDVIKMENLNWINVSDLQGMASPVRKLYNLSEELPYYYLIGHDGMIIMKGNRVPDLERLL